VVMRECGLDPRWETQVVEAVVALWRPKCELVENEEGKWISRLV
jgi:hypothetical protein